MGDRGIILPGRFPRFPGSGNSGFVNQRRALEEALKAKDNAERMLERATRVLCVAIGRLGGRLEISAEEMQNTALDAGFQIETTETGKVFTYAVKAEGIEGDT